MAISFGSLLEFGLSWHADDRSTYGKDQMTDLVNDALARVWGFTRWPFAIGDGVIALEAGPYETGTITTDGDTTIAGSSTAWDTNWPVPALLTIDGDPNLYLVTSFTSTTALVVDKAVQRSNASGLTYRLYFPAYELPSDFEAIEEPQQYNWLAGCENITYEHWLKYTSRAQFAGAITRYAILPGDGVNAGKIFLHPSPATAELVRFPYRKTILRGRQWDAGTASISNGATALTGSGTTWDTVGYSLSNFIFEVTGVAAVRGLQGLVSSVASATAITLSSAWAGATQSAVNYRLSTRINMPDLMLPCIREAIKATICEVRRDYAGLEVWERKWRDEARRASARLWPIGVSMEKAAAEDGSLPYDVSPPWPKLVVSGS